MFSAWEMRERHHNVHPDATPRASKSLPPESLPTVIELGSIIELAASSPMEHSPVYPNAAASDLTGQGNLQPPRGTSAVSSQSAGAGVAALERARRARCRGVPERV